MSSIVGPEMGGSHDCDAKSLTLERGRCPYHSRPSCQIEANSRVWIATFFGFGEWLGCGGSSTLPSVPATQETTTIERPETQSAKLQIPRFFFEGTGETEKGGRFSFEPTTLRRLHVGRSDVSDFKITDPTVSLRHAAIDFNHGHMRLTDLDSRNGTFVEGVKICSVYLSGGETIRFGSTEFRLDVDVSNNPVALANVTRFGRVIGSSPAMRGLYTLCEYYALEDYPVLIEGEIGTGKELLAEALHEVGPRAGGPFVVFDCSSAPIERLEAMLFGDEGNGKATPGVFEQAHEGTLLLDEVADLDPRVQADVLRVIETGQIVRVGSTTPVAVDVRLLATSRRDLEREVEADHFRKDLFYQFARHRLELPPLRDRAEDIEILASHFWTVMGAKKEIPEDFLRKAKTYSWPENVQELMNAVARRASVGAEARAFERTSPHSDATDVIGEVIRDDLAFPLARRRVLDSFERRYLSWVLEKHGGNVSRAAAAAGIARRYFYVVRSRIEV